MTVFAFILIGLAAGAVGGVLGIGGGIIYVPLMVTFFSFEQHIAQGTSLAVMVPSMLVAAVVHARAGRVDWKLAITLGAGAVVGGFGGARLALWMDALVLRRLFAGAMILMSARMLYQTQKGARQQRRNDRQEESQA
jgi:uncharacterized membrane protein YfcA